MPTPQGQNQLLLTAMGQLSQTIQQLDQHMQNSDQAAQQRVQQTNLNQQVQAQSQNASPTQATGRWGSGASTYMQDLANLDTMRSVPQQSGQNESTPPGSVADVEHQAQQSQQPQESSQQQTEQAMAFSLLGPEGGPAGAYYRKQYSINRNLAWAQSGTTLAQTQLGNYAENASGVSGMLAGSASNMLGGFNTALGWAQGTNEGQSTLSRAAGQGTSMAIGAGIPLGINIATNWNDLGSELGYAQQGTPRGLLGFNIGAASNINATMEGGALNREANELSGRGITSLLNGNLLGQLTHPQAQSAVETLAAQGFGTTPLGQNGQGLTNTINGNNPEASPNMAIASNLLTPLMQGGLSAQDAAQWTTALRNAGASVNDLMGTLGNLGTMAQQVRVPVAQMNAELEAVSQADMNAGAMPTTGLQAGQNFQAATGLQAQNMAQFFSSPMYQALASFQNGVNPLQVGGLSAGSQTQAALSTVQLLASISGGLGQGKNQYRTINGQRVLTQSGSSENIAMVQQLLQQQGINMNAQDVARLMSEGKHPQQIASVESLLGQAPTAYTAGTGLWSSNLSPVERAKMWQTNVSPSLRQFEGEGILTKQQVQKINAAKTTVGKGSKSQLLMKALEQGQGQSNQNQIQVHVTVGFTGQAKGVLKQTGKASSQISLAKIQQNSGGGPLTNTMLNTPGGDSASASDAMMNSYINSITSDDNNNYVTNDNNSLVTNDNNNLLTP